MLWINNDDAPKMIVLPEYQNPFTGKMSVLGVGISLKAYKGIDYKIFRSKMSSLLDRDPQNNMKMNV